MADFDRATVTLDGVSVAACRVGFDHVLIRPYTVDKKRASGLMLPDHVTGAMAGDLLYGEVVAAGPGALTSKGALVPPPCKAGDHVVFILGFGREVELREGPHWIVGRGGAHVGFQHGVILAYELHDHCWHLDGDGASATCDAPGCDAPRLEDGRAFAPLPSCTAAGPRLRALKRGYKAQSIDPGRAPPTGAAFLADQRGEDVEDE